MNTHRPSKTDRTRIQRAIRKQLKDKRNARAQAVKNAMHYVALRTGLAK